MFNQKTIIKNKQRAANFIADSDFFNFIHEDLRDRIQSLDKDIKDMLEVSYVENYTGVYLRGIKSHDVIARSHVEAIPGGLRRYYSRPHEIAASAKWPPRNDERNDSLDLIHFSFGLHWVNDVQKFLTNVKSLLKPNGIFICNFPVSGSLANLRKILFLAEESTGNQHFPHISPFIRFDDVPPLIQQAGFMENIIDCEVLTLEHESPIALMKWLKNIGESNSLDKRNHYSITKPIYQFLNNFEGSIFEDQINLVTLIASPSKGAIRLR